MLLTTRASPAAAAAGDDDDDDDDDRDDNPHHHAYDPHHDSVYLSPFLLACWMLSPFTALIISLRVAAVKRFFP